MTLRVCHLWITVVVASLAPFFFGSVDLFWVVTWTLMLGIAGLFGLSLGLGRRQRNALVTFFVLIGCYATIAAVQFIPGTLSALNDPIWAEAARILQTELPGRIAGRAMPPPISIGHVVLFFLACLNGFFLGTSSRSSGTLFRVLAFVCALYAAYGLASLLFAPNMLLWIKKTAYVGDLTATFVNRNTAASLVGTGAILWFCYTLANRQTFHAASLRTLLLLRSSENWLLTSVARACGFLLCLSALLATSSRGGLICAAAGLWAAAVPLLAYRFRLRRMMVLALAASSAAVVVAVVGNIGRIASQGVFDDNRLAVYRSLLNGILERPWFGYGAGSFQDTFPMLRTDEISASGIWEMGHSTILEIAIEMGLPLAIAAAVYAVGVTFFLMMSASTIKGDDRYIVAAAGGIAAFSFLHSLVDFSLQIPGYFTIFAVLLACGVSRACADRKVRSSRNPSGDRFDNVAAGTDRISR